MCYLLLCRHKYGLLVKDGRGNSHQIIDGSTGYADGGRRKTLSHNSVVGGGADSLRTKTSWGCCTAGSAAIEGLEHSVITPKSLKPAKLSATHLGKAFESEGRSMILRSRPTYKFWFRGGIWLGDECDALLNLNYVIRNRELTAVTGQRHAEVEGEGDGL
jgi:hypothetical protein